MWVFISVLTLFWISMPLAPQPPGEFSHNQPGIAFVLYVASIALAHWTDQNRTSRHELLSAQVVATGGSHE
jgi:hypothetical protein